MRILIITPSSFPNLTGNAITTERWRRSLIARGMEVEIFSASCSDPATLSEAIQRFHPDLVHVYHAFKSGTLLLKHYQETGSLPPFVLSPGGTDINLDLNDIVRKDLIIQIMRMARAIVAQSAGIEQSIQNAMPEFSHKIIDVPKACSWFGNEPFDLRERVNAGPDAILFFLPAGIRPVKGNLECLLAMERLHTLRPDIRFVSAGPAIDADYAARFEYEVQRLSSFACWIGAIPATAMHSAYISSDVIINASFSEGLSNCLLESIAAGRPFLASDIPGNRQPVLCGEGQTQAGCYFNPANTDDCITKALRLVDDEPFRKSLGTAANLRALQLASPAQEAAGLIKAYEMALSK